MLIDGVSDTGAALVGRSQADAPDIDGRVVVEGDDVVVGEFADVRITGASEYDLSGIAAG